MSDVRLIDAYALEKLFEEECAGECPICSYSHEGCPCGLIKTAPTVEAYTKDDMTNEYLKGYNACKDIIQPKGECIPVKDIINYIRICREELFEKMKDYHPREFEIRDNMLLNFEQMVKLANSKYKQI